MTSEVQYRLERDVTEAINILADTSVLKDNLKDEVIPISLYSASQIWFLLLHSRGEQAWPVKGSWIFNNCFEEGISTGAACQ